MDASSGGGSPHPSHASRSTSATLTGSPPRELEEHEHEDSPMRKKPRLETGDSPQVTDAASSPHQNPNLRMTTPDQQFPNNMQPAAPDGNTPSRITLNLRTPKSLSTAPSHSNGRTRSMSPTHTIENALRSNTDEGGEGEYTVLDASRLTPPKQSSPPVVDISLDDTGSEKEDNNVNNDERDLSFDLDVMINDFPKLQYNFEETRLSLTRLEELATWLDNWISLTQARPDVWCPIYTKYHQHFVEVGQTMFKILTNKRYNLAPAIPRRATIADSLRRLFEAYLDLCSQLALSDVENIARGYASTLQLRTVERNKHLRNLQLLLFRPESTSLWRLANEVVKLDRRSIILDTAPRLLISSQSSKHSWFDLAASLVEIVQDDASLCETVHVVLSIGNEAFSCLVESIQEYSDRQVPMCLVQHSSQTPILQMREALSLSAEEQSSNMSTEFIHTMLDLLSKSWELALAMEPEGAEKAIEPWAHVSKGLNEYYFSQLQGHAFGIVASRRLMIKGRLESRARATLNLGAHLQQFYELTQRSPLPEAHDAISACTANWLVEQQIVQQVLNIETHPEVVSKSFNIFGYLLITGTWSPALTTILFEIIKKSQDLHMKHTVVSTVASVLQYAHTRFCKDFAEQMMHSSANTAQPGLVTLFCRAANVFWGRSQDPQTLVLIFEVALEILRQFSLRTREQQAETPYIQADSQNLLRTMAKFQGADIAIEQLLRNCVQDISECSPTIPGSVSAIDYILDSADTRNASIICSLLIDTLSVPDLLVRSLATMSTDCAKDSSTKQRLELAFTPLVRILVQLLTFKSDYHLDQDLEPQLWRCLVGEAALDDHLRDTAWYLLTSTCDRGRPANSFIERCIREFLPLLKSEYFTSGLVKFVDFVVKNGADYEPSDGPNTEEDFHFPLADLLWRVVLESHFEIVTTQATSVLCNFYVRSDIITRSPTSSIAICHDKFIGQAVEELTNCAKELYVSSPTSVEEPSSPVPVPNVHSLRFKRATDCFRLLLSEAQSEPKLVCTLEERQSASPKSATHSPVGESVTIRYQAFPSNGAIVELRVDSSTPLHELYEILRRKTRFADLKTIHNGATIDLRSMPDLTVDMIAERPGLLLVKNTQLDRLLPSSLDTTGSQTTVGNAISTRFESLYPLLDLPDYLSVEIYLLLRQFPPYEHVKTLLGSNAAPLDVFHPRHKYKTLYSLHCLLQVVTSLEMRKTEDRECLIRMSDKLIQAFTDRSVATLKLDSSIDQEIAGSFVEGLLHCIRPLLASADSDVIVKQAREITFSVSEVLLRSSGKANLGMSSLIRTAHDCVVELSYRSGEALSSFIGSSNAATIHEMLLLKDTDIHARQHIQRNTQALARFAVDQSEKAANDTFYTLWNLLVSIVPASASFPAQSQQFFQLMVDVCPFHGRSEKAKNEVRQLVIDWLNLLIRRPRQQRVVPEVPEPFVFGMSKLIITCLNTSSLTLPDEEAMLSIISIFQSLLFPPIFHNGASHEISTASTSSVLHSETRKQVYELVLALSSRAAPFQQLLRLMRNLTLQRIPDDLLGWKQNRFSLIRSTTGYAGLRNLTNTCYMNSLMAQLYMNPKFREFILGASVSDRARQRLLLATRDLFDHMQRSQRKYADTEEFAYSIKPMDGPVIDVSVQMDVDEFYNLLFEQWEDQISNKDSKKEFRAIYGGTSVTQIKSLDCEHISERTEEYMTISCEVKGKQTLHDSLQAFIAGDTMEGDNKYKCESCGNRYVNAVKRSCLKDIPDNLAFHLKRFDFDLESMQRRKLYDYFAFPRDLDMAPYKYESVAQDGPSAAQDMFDLVGVLVHSGTAEVGHYYSYIRDSASSPDESASWFEFNDIDVSDFDPKKIDDCCFGGSWDAEHWRHMPKMNSAYMLFYKRRSAQKPDESQEALSPQRANVSGARQHPTGTSDAFLRENDLLIRWFCLMDPQHGNFLQTLMTSLGESSLSVLDHSQHSTVRDLVDICIDYLQNVANRLKEPMMFEQTAFTLESLLQSCQGCCADAVDMLVDGQPSPLTDMLLFCPDPKIRTQTQDLVLTLVQQVRNSDDNEISRYGLSVEHDSPSGVLIDARGVFGKLMDAMLLEMPDIGCYADKWGQYFTLLTNICDFGRLECYALLTTDLLFRSMVLLFAMDLGEAPAVPLISSYWERSSSSIARLKKYVKGTHVLELIANLVKCIDFTKAVEMNPKDRPRHAQPGSSLMPLTYAEHYVAFVEHEQNAAFVARCLEATSDEDAEVSAARFIVGQMLHNCEDQAVFRLVSQTINGQIRDYDNLWQHLPLSIALPFCRYALDSKLVQELLMTLRKKIISLQHNFQFAVDNFRRAADLKDQNGAVFSRFFLDLCEIEKPRCGNHEEESFLRQLVFETLPSCGPQLLLYDSQNNRAKAFRAMQSIILTDIKPPPDGELSLSDFDALHVSTLVNFVSSGVAAYSSSKSRRIAPIISEILIDALDACMKLLKKIERQSERVPAFAEVLEDINDHYVTVSRQWQVAKEDFENYSEMQAVMVEEDDTEAISEVDEGEEGGTDRGSPSLSGSPLR